MNEKKKSQNNKETVSEKQAKENKAKLLEIRKAQAKELARLKEDNFSLEDALDEMKSSLLVDDESEVNNASIPLVEEVQGEETIVSEPDKESTSQNDEAKEQERLAKEKEKERLAKEKEKQKEKERLAKEKEKQKEKERLAKEKEKQKEKERLAKEKAKQKEKERLAKEKEKQKEKERLAKEKAKQKEKERLAKEKEKQKEKERLAKEKERLTKVAKPKKPKALEPKEEKKDFEETSGKGDEQVVSIVSKENVKNGEEKISENNNESVENKDIPTFKSVGSLALKQEPITDPDGKVIIDNLQKLREQIMAQKKLEKELMEKEAAKTQQKDKSIMDKLSQLEKLAKEDTFEEPPVNKGMEEENAKLQQELKQANNKYKRLLNLKYNEVAVFEKDKLSKDFLKKIEEDATKELKEELKEIKEKTILLRKEHDEYLNSRGVDVVNEKIKLLNKETKELSARIELLNKELLEKDRNITSLNEENKHLKFSQKDVVVAEVDKLEKKHKIELQNREVEIQKLQQELQKIQEQAIVEKESLQQEYNEYVLKVKELEHVYNNNLELLKGQNARKEQEYQQQIVAFQQKVKELESNSSSVKLDELKSHYEDLLSQKEQAISKLQEETKQVVNDYENKIATLNVEILELGKEKDALSINYEEKIKALNIEVLNLTKEKENYIQKNNELNNLRFEYEQKIQTLNNEVDTLNKEKASLSKNEEALQALHDEYDAKVKALNTEILEIKTEKEKEDHRVLQLEDELHVLKVAREEYLQNVGSKEKELLSLKQTISELQLELDTEKELNGQLNIEYDKKYNSELSYFKKELESQRDIVASLRLELDTKTNELMRELNLQKDLLTESKNQLDAKEKEISSLHQELVNKNDELSTKEGLLNKQHQEVEEKTNEVVAELKDELQSVRNTYDNRLNNLGLQLEEANRVIAELKSKIEQDAIEFTKLRNEIEEERKHHNLIQQKLNKDLEIKEAEVEKLKDEIKKFPLEQSSNKLETQIKAISSLVDELENKTKDSMYKNTILPFINQPYNPLYSRIELDKLEYQRELEKRDRIIESLQKQKTEEIVQEDPKIAELESKVKELTEVIQKLSNESSQVGKDQEQDEMLKNIKAELEEYKALNERVLQEINNPVKKESNLIQEAVENYTRDKDALTFAYNNELTKLEIEYKFSTTDEEKEKIAAKIKDLKHEYTKRLDAKDISFQKEIFGITTNKTVAPGIVDEKVALQEDEVVEEPQVQESQVQEPQVEEELPSEEAIAKENTDLLATPTSEEKKETVVVKKETIDDSDNFKFVATIDQNYINRLNYIRKLRSILEGKLENENKKLQEEYQKNEQDIREIEEKIREVKERIAKLDEASKDKSMSSSEIDNEHNRLYIELDNREEQLRKLREDEHRKIELRHKSSVQNIEDQLHDLDIEEKELKESYLQRKQKDANRIKREKELKEKLELEKKQEESIPDEEERVIESNAEKKQRLLHEDAVEEKNPRDKEKEIELLKTYDRYIKVAKQMSNSFPEVARYKRLRAELRGLEEDAQKYQNMLASNPDNKNRLLLDDVNAKKEYYEKQINILRGSKSVDDYEKLIENIIKMKEFLIKYEQRGKAVNES